MGGLAAAIFAAMAFMLLAGFAVLFWVARAVARARGWSGAKARNAGLLGGLAGLGFGMLAVAATFFESSWMPPPRLDFVTPPGYAHEWTILLEDPRAAAKLNWQGPGLPFTQRHASVSVPSSGIMRVQSFGEALGRGDLAVGWGDGSPHTGSGMGPAPASTGANYYIAVNRGGPATVLPYDKALGQMIAQREGRTTLPR